MVVDYDYGRPKCVKLSFSLPSGVLRDLRLLAFRAERPVSQVVALAVTDYLSGSGKLLVTSKGRRKLLPKLKRSDKLARQNPADERSPAEKALAFKKREKEASDALFGRD